jgi:hypothetical protein
MILTVQLIAVLLVALAMSLALAHALELPGKKRLDERTYIAVQTIYYPGFTLGGVGEPLALIATLVLMLATPRTASAFWWTVIAFVGVVVMHAIFWLVTQPVNRYWLKNQRLGNLGQRFFSPTQGVAPDPENQNWVRLRDRWEYSHLVRAICSVVAFVAVIIAVLR